MKRLYYTALWMFVGLGFVGAFATIFRVSFGPALAVASGWALLVVIVWPTLIGRWE